MSNKKRHKKYRGRDAATTQPVVKKFSIDPNKPAWRIWLEDNKLRVRRWIILGVLLLVPILIFWLVAR